MFYYVLLVALVAAVAVAFVARGRERMASTSVMSIIGLLVVDAMDRVGAHETIPFWHWGAVAVGMPFVMALGAAVLLTTRLHVAPPILLLLLRRAVAPPPIAAPLSPPPPPR